MEDRTGTDASLEKGKRYEEKETAQKIPGKGGGVEKGRSMHEFPPPGGNPTREEESLKRGKCLTELPNSDQQKKSMGLNRFAETTRRGKKRFRSAEKKLGTVGERKEDTISSERKGITGRGGADTRRFLKKTKRHSLKKKGERLRERKKKKKSGERGYKPAIHLQK